METRHGDPPMTDGEREHQQLTDKLDDLYINCVSAEQHRANDSRSLETAQSEFASKNQELRNAVLEYQKEGDPKNYKIAVDKMDNLLDIS